MTESAAAAFLDDPEAADFAEDPAPRVPFWSFCDAPLDPDAVPHER